ncbi:GTPase, partial [Candidatus Undinarchaeota archaeon]
LIRKADVIIEVIDARNPEGTRSKDIEKRIKNYGKRFVIAINKCDLISKEESERIKKKLARIGPTVFTSATKKLGTSKLREAIRTTAPKLPAKVAMVGYPNVGKSQLSNALKGKSAARVSPVPGHTRSQQWISVSKNIRLYDTPGVIPRWESEESLVMKFAVDPDKMKFPEKAAADILKYLMRKDEEIVFSRYGVVGSPEEVLVEIAKRRGKLLKGGIPDTITAAKIVIREWNKGILSTAEKDEE